jgi:transposase-like protein
VLAKLWDGSYLPDCLLQPRQRVEQAFVSVIADACLAGVSRLVEELVQQLGVGRISKSQVMRLASSLDGVVEDFCTRPLDGAP